MRDVPEGVEDRLRAAARAVGGGELGDPGRGRVPGKRERTGDRRALRDGQRDDVHAARARRAPRPSTGREAPRSRPARRSSRPGSNCGAQNEPSFGSFQITTSSICGLSSHDIGDVAAVLAACGVGPRRVRRLAVHADDDAEPAGVELELVEQALVLGRDRGLARVPLQGDPDRAQSEPAGDRCGVL